MFLINYNFRFIQITECYFFLQSNKICLGAYESQWFQKSVNIQKKVFQIMFRSQKPEIICINGFLPTLSLRYYAGVNMMPYMFL